MSISVPKVAPISAADYTPVSVFGALLISYMEPWLTLHLAWLLDALGVMCDPLFELVSDVGLDDGVSPTIGTIQNGELVTEGYAPGYSILLDPSRCPADDLPFLSQFVGVTLPAGADETTARSLVMNEAGLNRGTDSAVIAAAQRTLTGTKSVTLVPRTYVDGTANAGWFGVICLSAECPSQAATEAAVNAVKFGGLLPWFEFVSGFTISELEADFASITLAEAAFANITDCEGDVT